MISYNRSNYQRSSDNYQNRSINNSQNRKSSYNKRQRFFSNLLTGIITAIQIHNIDIEVTHQSIKDKLTKYKQLKNQLQTHLVSMIQETPNYN